MSFVVRYTSIPNLLIGWFATVCDQLSVSVEPTSMSTDLPDGYKDFCPFIRISRTGGPRRNSLDTPTVRVEVFALSYDTAETLANELDSLIEWALPSHTNGEASVLTTESISAPTWAPWDDQPVTRFIATYRLRVAHLSS